MPSKPPTDSGAGGVVRWIAPPTKRPKPSHSQSVSRQRISDIRSGTGGSPTRPESPESNSDQETDKENKRHSSSTSASQQHRSTVQIDANLCKVICSFVDEHLNELQRHQKLIANARASQKQPHLHPTDSFSIPSQSARVLAVRDEQTKANATIKQLTNYLKEVTILNERCDNPANRHLVHEELANKIATTKSRIIDAINEFIRSNRDYDLPVEECLKIHSTNQYMQAQHATNSTNSPLTSHRDATLIEPATIVIINENGHQEELYTVSLQASDQAEADRQVADLEKCRRDMMKLERDTEEMKRLFTEFYSLVKNQGEQIDSIEDNIMIATHHISEGHNSLSKTKKGLTVLVPVTGCMAGALIGGPLGLVVGGKLGGITIGCVTSLLGLFSSFSLRKCIPFDKLKSD